MPITIPVAHDFSCPWCWIGFFQVKRMVQEFGVQIDWLSYDLFPDELPIDPPGPRLPKEQPNRPDTPSRLALAYAAEGMNKPTGRPAWNLRTHSAHEAVEFAKTLGVQDELVERIYRAIWERSENVQDPEVLVKLADGLISNLDELRAVIDERRFADRIVGFDDAAYASGVYNVPTYFIGGERYAEQPYSVIRDALLKAMDADSSKGLYAGISLGKPHPDRPYTIINMVTTIDGKTITGERDEPVMDLGSQLDHATMRNLQAACDAVLVGAGSLRSTPGIWYPAHLKKFVVTQSGNVDEKSRFFTDQPELAYVIAPKSARDSHKWGTRLYAIGDEKVDFRELLSVMRHDWGVERLLVEGGSELNAQLLEANLVDELFLTLAPKIKLGRSTPTYAGGNPLPRDQVQNYELIQQTVVENEVFLRYRRVKA